MKKKTYFPYASHDSLTSNQPNDTHPTSSTNPPYYALPNLPVDLSTTDPRTHSENKLAPPATTLSLLHP